MASHASRGQGLHEARLIVYGHWLISAHTTSASRAVPGVRGMAQAGTYPPEPVNFAEVRIRREQVLGGLTHEYHVAA